MKMRGVIEGFYGTPWSHAERLDLIRFCAQHGLNTWVYAPKDDPYHRKLWRDPYPEQELAQLGELVAECARVGVDFAYAIAPGMDICYSHEAEWEKLRAKIEQVRTVGVVHFQLLWDDVEHKLYCPEDEALYGNAERPTGAAQAPFSNRFAREIEQPGPLVVCPMAYAATGDGPYRRCFRPELDPSIVLYWTGPEVVSLAIHRDELDMSVHRYAGHEHLLWDNFPVNDWDTTILHLGPLRGRDPNLAHGKLRGIIANAMVQAVPSKLALATVADWARDPFAYDPLESYERALGDHGAEVLEALGEPADDVEAPDDLAAVCELLKLGVTAPVGAALLRPYV
ncbi:MAG TPA: protein O-GlcNAcase [Gaiellaceae bacterium]